MLDDGTVGREKPLGLSWRFEALHAPFPLARGLVGVLRAVVQIAVLPMLHAGQDLPLGGTIARQFIGTNDAWDIPTALEYLKTTGTSHLAPCMPCGTRPGERASLRTAIMVEPCADA